MFGKTEKVCTFHPKNEKGEINFEHDWNVRVDRLCAYFEWKTKARAKK